MKIQFSLLFKSVISNREEVEEISNKLRIKVFRSSVKDNFNISEGTAFHRNKLQISSNNRQLRGVTKFHPAPKFGFIYL